MLVREQDISAVYKWIINRLEKLINKIQIQISFVNFGGLLDLLYHSFWKTVLFFIFYYFFFMWGNVVWYSTWFNFFASFWLGPIYEEPYFIIISIFCMVTDV